MENKFKHIYGPVESWRMGKSVGIDPLSETSKICNLDCIYCQLGTSRVLTDERKEYVSTVDILRELVAFPVVKGIDYYTFSGRGEPTLALNLGEMIRGVKQFTQKDVAVITNSTLMFLPEVRIDLSLADYVIAKLDACDELSFQVVDKAMSGTSFENTLEGITHFKMNYTGKLAIQVMFVEENRRYAHRIADIVREINADEIQINTPLRASAAHPLTEDGIREIKSHFAGLPAVCVYERERKETVPVDTAQTIKRHGQLNTNG